LAIDRGIPPLGNEPGSRLTGGEVAFPFLAALLPTTFVAGMSSNLSARAGAIGGAFTGAVIVSSMLSKGARGDTPWG